MITIFDVLFFKNTTVAFLSFGKIAFGIYHLNLELKSFNEG